MSRNASIILAVVVLAGITGVLLATTTETTVRTLALAAPGLAGLAWWRLRGRSG